MLTFHYGGTSVKFSIVYYCYHVIDEVWICGKACSGWV